MYTYQSMTKKHADAAGTNYNISSETGNDQQKH